MHRIKLMVLVVIAATALPISAVPASASAQGYEGWTLHPYPNAGYWWCEHYGSEYRCWFPAAEQWFPANLDWYDQAAEMEPPCSEPTVGIASTGCAAFGVNYRLMQKGLSKRAQVRQLSLANMPSRTSNPRVAGPSPAGPPTEAVEHVVPLLSHAYPNVVSEPTLHPVS